MKYFGYETKSPLLVIIPYLEISMNAPDAVSYKPFDVNITLSNFYPIDISGDLILSTSAGKTTMNVTVPANSSKTTTMQTSLKKDETISSWVSGVSGAVSKAIKIGSAIAINVTPPPVSPPGNVEIEYLITNTGTLETDVPVTFAVGGESESVLNVAPAGGSVTGKIMFSLTRGQHILTWNSLYGAGSCKILVDTADFAVSGDVALSQVKIKGDKVKPGTKNNSLGIIAAGSQANISFDIINKSNFSDSADVVLNLDGIFNAERTMFIESGKTGNLSFNIEIPEELASGVYPLVITLNGLNFKYEYEVDGNDISAAVAIDKQAYRTGDTVNLTLDINNAGDAVADVIIRINYLEHVEDRTVNLPANGPIQEMFNFTATESDSVSIQIIASSGRSIYINTLSVNVKNGLIVYTDKQEYKSGDKMIVTVNTDKATTTVLSFAGTSEYMEFDGAGTQTWEFTLSEMPRGIYYIKFKTNEEFGKAEFDFDGPEIIISEAKITPEVVSGDSDILVELGIQPYKITEAVFNFTILDELGNTIAEWKEKKSGLAADVQTTVSFQKSISIACSGIHTLTYWATDKNENYTVVSGNITFDGDASNVIPKILAVYPGADEKDVLISRAISATFNTIMDKASCEGAFSITPAVECNFIWVKPNIMIAYPKHRRLNPNVEYTCKIASSAKSENGKNIQGDYTWKFTTGEFVNAQFISDVLVERIQRSSGSETLYDINGDGIIDIADIVTWINQN